MQKILSNNKVDLLKIAELGLKGEKSAILAFLQKLASQELAKKRTGVYNNILDLVDKYVSDDVTSSSFNEEGPFYESLSFDMNNIWLPENTRNKIDRFVNLQKNKNKGLISGSHLNKLLLYGPPGSGKTTLGFYIAKLLNKPVSYAKVSDLLSSRLGETMRNITELFKEAGDSIIFIDEFDAFAKKRTDGNDVGELKRVVNSIIQTFDFHASGKIVIVSTNLIDTLDPAIVRRFGSKIHIGFLNEEEAENFIVFLLKKEIRINIKLSPKELALLVKIISFIKLQTVDEIKLFLDKSIIASLISEKTNLTLEDFIETIFSEDYVNHQNIKELKNSDKKTLSSLAKYLESMNYPKLTIAKLMGIHRNSYKNYVEEV